MAKLKIGFLILFLFSFFLTFAQPAQPRGSKSVTFVDANLRASQSFGLPILNDTSDYVGLDSVGMQIYVKQGTNKGTWVRTTNSDNVKYWQYQQAAVSPSGNVEVVASIPALQAYSGLSNTLIVVDSLRGGVFNYYTSGLTIDNGLVFPATGKGSGYWKRDLSGNDVISVGWYTNDSTSNGSAFLNAAANAAVANRKSVIHIPYSTFNAGTTTDLKGKILAGNNTYLSGIPKRYGKLESVFFAESNNVNPEFQTQSPLVKYDESYKLLWRYDLNNYFIIVGDKNYNYLLYHLNNKTTTVSNSLASSTTDSTSWRMTEVLPVADVKVAWKINQDTIATSYDSAILSAGTIATGIGTRYSYYQFNDLGGYMEWDIPVTESGLLTASFYMSSSGTNAAKVYIDGTLIDSFSLNKTTGIYVLTRHYSGIKQGIRKVKIQNGNTIGDKLNFIGFNFFDLKDYDARYNVNYFGYTRDTVNAKGYLYSNSANDYAIYDIDASKYGGSYHGGERNIHSKFLLDEVYDISDTIAVGFRNFKLFKSLTIEQNFDIDWSAYGGGYLHGIRKDIFGSRNSYSTECSFSGDVNLKEFYIAMFGSNQQFHKIVYPVQKDINDIADDERYYLGKTGKYIVENPDTKQKLQIEYTTVKNDYSATGGPHVWRKDGIYNKFYYPWIYANNQNVKDFSFTTTYTFTNDSAIAAYGYGLLDTMTTVYKNISDTTSVINVVRLSGSLPVTKGGTGLSSIAADKMLYSSASNTLSTVDFKSVQETAYTGSITWTGTTAPSGSTNNTYRWQRVGNVVNLQINLVYGVAGSAITAVIMELPSDCPLPDNPDGLGSANNFNSFQRGNMSSSATTQTTSTTSCTLQINSGGTGYQIQLVSSSISARYVWASITYFTN